MTETLSTEISRLTNQTWLLTSRLGTLHENYLSFVEDPDLSKAENRRQRSALAQQALRIADDMALVSAEVRRTYWGLRDRDEV